MKTCQAVEHGEPCTYPVWGKGFCKFHQHLRTDKKPKAICKMTAHKARQQKESISHDKAFYMTIWESRKHQCLECLATRSERSFLGNEPHTYNFDHVLEKGESRFAHLRHEERNIQLICMTHHSSKTSGFLSSFQKLLRTSTIRHFEEIGLLPKLSEVENE